METPLLSAKEATNQEDALADALETYLEYIDSGIWRLVGDRSQQPILSDMTDDERHVVARVLLRAGVRSPVAAFVVRQTINMEDTGKFLVIVGPRLWDTGKLVLPVVVPMVTGRKRGKRASVSQ